MKTICINVNVLVDCEEEHEEALLEFGQNGEGDDLHDYVARYFRDAWGIGEMEVEVRVVDAFEAEAED